MVLNISLLVLQSLKEAYSQRIRRKLTEGILLVMIRCYNNIFINFKIRSNTWATSQNILARSIAEATN